MPSSYRRKIKKGPCKGIGHPYYPRSPLVKTRTSRQCGRSSGVEHNLAKVGVEGSNPFARSNFSQKFEHYLRPYGAVFAWNTDGFSRQALSTGRQAPPEPVLSSDCPLEHFQVWPNGGNYASIRHAKT